MPLPMVHLYIAKNIHDYGFKITDLSQFYLGTISPDAIHMRDNTDRNDKIKTHLSEGKKWSEIDEMDFYRFIIGYIRKNEDTINKSFLWGYCIHILTDMHWSKSIFLEFTEKYRNDKSPIQDERMAYYNDTDILDHALFNEGNNTKNLWNNLEISTCLDFLNLLTENEIDLWKERTLHWYDSGESKHKNPIKYITKIDIEKFINKYSKIIFNNINKQ